MSIKSAVIAGVALAVCAAGSAAAQKSKDTLRLALQEPIKGVDYYLGPTGETSMMQAVVYDSLIAYDEDANKFQPLLAKSWKRIDDKTLEFELRDDVKWHDGAPFTAEDVVYTLDWLLDPATKLRFKDFWAWIDKTEKTGPNTVRITARTPTAFDESRIAYLTGMLPKHIHAKLEDKLVFGRAPVGTGMYRVTRVEENRGITLEQNPAFTYGGTARPVTNVKRIDFSFLPDAGTQTAQFLAGNLDVLRDVDIEQAAHMAQHPRVDATLVESISWFYMAIDARGRSGLKPLQDIRVRQALMMGVDRDELRKLIYGNHPATRDPKSLCWDFQAGCAYTAPLPKHDPAAARKLLAEAGYPNGFELEITTFASAIRRVAEAAANQLSKIGIRASVDALPLLTYAKKQTDGKIQVIVASYPAGLMPDVSGTASFLFTEGPRDYFGDSELHAWSTGVQTTLDPAKRQELGHKLFDAATERAYAIPLAANPIMVVHSADVRVAKIGSFTGFGIDMWDLNWK
jgi:peptide/nickel transport system substrate-binding protein